MGSVLFGSLALLVLLGLWALFPDRRMAQGVLVLLALVGFSGTLQIHRLALDLESRHWSYRRGWAWRPPLAEGTFEDLGCVAIEENELADGLVASKLRSRLLFLEFGRFGVDGHDGRFPLGFAMGPNVAPDRAHAVAERLGVEVQDRTTDSSASDPRREPEADHPATTQAG